MNEGENLVNKSKSLLIFPPDPHFPPVVAYKHQPCLLFFFFSPPSQICAHTLLPLPFLSPASSLCFKLLSRPSVILPFQLSSVPQRVLQQPQPGQPGLHRQHRLLSATLGRRRLKPDLQYPGQTELHRTGWHPPLRLCLNEVLFRIILTVAASAWGGEAGRLTTGTFY